MDTRRLAATDLFASDLFASDLFASIETLRKTRPLVLCLTNDVAQNWTANVLLAAGCSPLMSREPSEIGEICGVASSVLLNIGTATARDAELMLGAARAMAAQNKPRILDPVGCGFTRFRTDLSQTLLPLTSHVRCNQDEAFALAGQKSEATGVDSGPHSTAKAVFLSQMPIEPKQLWLITGETDLIRTADATATTKNGSPLMTKVTAMGCALSSLLAAFAGLGTNRLELATACSLYFSVCGEIAEEQARGIGDFSHQFLTALENLDEKTFVERARIEF